MVAGSAASQAAAAVATQLRRLRLKQPDRGAKVNKLFEELSKDTKAQQVFLDNPVGVLSQAAPCRAGREA
jgi:hypothetical protein